MDKTPYQIAEERVELAGLYARDSELLIDILEQKSVLWTQLRDSFKTNAEADRAWEATPMGVNEMKLKLRMKASEKRMSALKSMLDVLEGEARNQY